MIEEESVAILTGLDDERAADVLEEMDPDDAADILNEIPEDTRVRLLELMEPEEAEDVRMLLEYDEYTAGGMMTPEPVILAPDSTVAEALARIRNSDLPPALAAQVYVCRSPLEVPTGRYLGSVHFQRLLRETPSALVTEAVDSELEPVAPESTAARGHQRAGVLQPRRDPRGRRERPAARRRHRRRRDRPHAARRLAQPGADRRGGDPMARELRRSRLDQPRGPRRGVRSPYDPETFGKLSERISRFIGSWRFIF